MGNRENIHSTSYNYKHLNGNETDRITRNMTNLSACGCLFFGLTTALFILYGGFNSHVYAEQHALLIESHEVKSPAGWTWSCDNDLCKRRYLRPNETTVSRETCSMTCGPLPLWPQPKYVSKNLYDSVSFRNVKLLNLNSQSYGSRFLKNSFEIFQSYMEERNLSQSAVNTEDVLLSINLENDEDILTINTNESYVLTISKSGMVVTANISAYSCFGARHALETLSQLIWHDPVANQLRIVNDVIIKDEPKFSHRGFHIDTARNFFSVTSLKNIVNGMAANKLNVLHLHLTDATSFPIILPNNQQFSAYGAYSDDMKYSVSDMKGLIEYAKQRGIRTLLEVDAPSHVYEGWTWDENLVICGEDNIFNGHLNPDYFRVYDVLESIYRDLLKLGSAPDTFHIGGDEVNLTCWRNTDSRAKYSDDYQMWAEFTNQMIERVRRAKDGKIPNQVVLWSSPLTDKHVNLLKYKENIVVQYWYGKIQPITDAGLKIIFSTVGKWYLDCGFGPWRPKEDHGSCDPYTPWTKVYEYRPWTELSSKKHSLVMGGEACLWSEEVDEADLSTRAWPRGAAFAERLWSDPTNMRRANVAIRLQQQADRMLARGIKSAAIWPRWCSLNPGRCQ